MLYFPDPDSVNVLQLESCSGNPDPTPNQHSIIALNPTATQAPETTSSLTRSDLILYSAPVLSRCHISKFPRRYLQNPLSPYLTDPLNPISLPPGRERAVVRELEGTREGEGGRERGGRRQRLWGRQRGVDAAR
eukprot:1992416-Rhodomonas_salina.1